MQLDRSHSIFSNQLKSTMIIIGRLDRSEDGSNLSSVLPSREGDLKRKTHDHQLHQRNLSHPHTLLYYAMLQI